MFVAQADEIRPQYLNPDNNNAAAIFSAGIVRDVGPTLGASTQEATANLQIPTVVGSLGELATPWYSDQILPFDITLACSNEYGALAGSKILGVEILSEGTGVSIDDTVTETQATFVARALEPLQAMPSPFNAQATRSQNHVPPPVFALCDLPDPLPQTDPAQPADPLWRQGSRSLCRGQEAARARRQASPGRLN